MRTELLREARSGGQDTDKRQLRAQLGALDDNLEAQLESLSCALTEEELTACFYFQELQQVEVRALRSSGGRLAINRNALLANPIFQGGSGKLKGNSTPIHTMVAK